MKRLLPYLLSVLVVALVVSSLNLSINATKKNENVINAIPINDRDSFMKEEQLRRQNLMHDGSGIDFFSFGTRKIEKSNQYFLRLGEINRRGPVTFEGDTLRALTATEVDRLVTAGAQVVDVRPLADFGVGHVPGSVSIPLRPVFATWLGWLIDDGSPIVVVRNPDHAALGEIAEQAIGAAITVVRCYEQIVRSEQLHDQVNRRHPG